MAVYDCGIEVRKMIRLLNSILILLFIFLPISAIASWTGPVTIITGGLGSATDQFGMSSGDTDNTYAILSGVSSDGRVLVVDSVNNRIKVYKDDGSLLYIINSPAQNPNDYGISAYFVGDSIFSVVDKFYFFDKNGKNMDWNAPSPSNYINSIVSRNGELYLEETKPEHKWLVYAQDGELKTTSQSSPQELGQVMDHIFVYGGKQYHRVVINFSGKIWDIVGDYGSCGNFSYRLDKDNNLYCASDSGIQRYSKCGVVTASFGLPEDNETTVQPDDPAADPIVTINQGYDSLQLADDGSLYASEFTVDSYSIVKWTWQNSPDDPVGGPDAPVQLEGVSDTTGSVMLKWVYSLQDPGCVTGYEVGRATTTGGPYIAVGTVQPGDINKGYSYHDTTGKSGTTYYYAVRAVSAIGDSPYSNEVSVTVK
jgi:hypothetical protein